MVWRLCIYMHITRGRGRRARPRPRDEATGYGTGGEPGADHAAGRTAGPRHRRSARHTRCGRQGHGHAVPPAARGYGAQLVRGRGYRRARRVRELIQVGRIRAAGVRRGRPEPPERERAADGERRLHLVRGAVMSSTLTISSRLAPGICMVKMPSRSVLVVLAAMAPVRTGAIKGGTRLPAAPSLPPSLPPLPTSYHTTPHHTTGGLFFQGV